MKELFPLLGAAGGIGGLCYLYYLVVKQFGRKKGSGIETARLSKSASAVLSVLIICVSGGLIAYAIYQWSHRNSSNVENYKSGALNELNSLEFIVEADRENTPDSEAYSRMMSYLAMCRGTLKEALEREDLNRVYETRLAIRARIQSAIESGQLSSKCAVEIGCVLVHFRPESQDSVETEESVPGILLYDTEKGCLASDEVYVPKASSIKSDSIIEVNGMKAMLESNFTGA